MIVQDVYQKIEENTSYNSTVTAEKSKMLSVINLTLKKFYLKLDLRTELTSATLSTVASTANYYLDSRVMKLLNMVETTDQDLLEYMTREQFELRYPYPASTETGQPTTYVDLGKVKCSTQPTSASTLSVVSSSASDITSYYVLVKGISSGRLVKERLLLTGATPVVSTNSYTEVLSITKDATNGTVTVTSNSGVVTNITLLPTDKEREFFKIRLYPLPDDAYTIAYSFYPLPEELTYDEESVPLPDTAVEAFINECISTLLFQQGDKKFTAWSSKGIDSILDTEDKESSADWDLRFGFAELDYTEDQHV